MGVGFTTILGELGDSTMEWMLETRFGVLVILLYSLITQVMLVNLLIAMMGDTYSAVKENSDKEWKFYRYSLIVDYQTSSAYPPPFNIVLGPIFWLREKIRATTVKARLEAINIKQFHALQLSTVDRENEMYGSKTVVKMKLAKEKVLEQEASEELDTLHSVSSVVREHMRILNTQRDSDRLYLEHNMQTILKTLANLQTQIDKIAAASGMLVNNNPPPPSPLAMSYSNLGQAAASSSSPAPAPAAPASSPSAPPHSPSV